MKTRIISALIGLPLLLFIVVQGGWWLRIAAGVLGLVGMREFYKAFFKRTNGAEVIGYFFGCVYVIFLDSLIYGSALFSVFVSVFLIALLIYSVFCYHKTNASEILTAFFGFFYACFLLSHIYLVREYTHGKLLVWLVFLAAFGCDTGAYFAGVRFGKHKLCPTLSPKKTIEGSIGGIVTATMLSLVYGLWVESAYPLEGANILLLCGLTGFFGSLLAQVGDLAASSFKRQTGIKDYGKLMPGHGGVLDRFDSVLLTAPVLYYIMLFLIRM